MPRGPGGRQGYQAARVRVSLWEEMRADRVWTSQQLGGPGWPGGRGAGRAPLLPTSVGADQCGHRPGPLPHLTLPFLSSQMAGEAASLSRKGLRSFILK